MATRTVKQSGGDFTTLASALADAGTAASDTIEISGTWSAADTAAATVSDASITIQAVGSSRHPGYVPASPTHYRLYVNGANNIAISATGTIIDGLDTRQDDYDTYYDAVNATNYSGTLKNCLVYLIQLGSAGNRGLNVATTSSTTLTWTVENSIFWNWDGRGISANRASGGQTTVLNINSCTVFNCGDGIHGRNSVNDANFSVNVFNSISIGSTNDYAVSGTQSGVIVWNIHNSIDGDNTIASRDAAPYECLASRSETDSDSPGAGNWVVFRDITNTPNDLRLKSNAENDAQDVHLRTSGAGLSIPATGIAGNVRPNNTNYDIGADEYVRPTKNTRAWPLGTGAGMALRINQ